MDWARTCGFPVVAAGRGHKWLPHFSESTPETVWGNYGLTPEQAERGGLNPKMFNSFLDGSKPSIESTAVANATGLTVPSNGLLYPPASVEDIPYVTRPISEGGVLERKGMVDIRLRQAWQLTEQAAGDPLRPLLVEEKNRGETARRLLRRSIGERDAWDAIPRLAGVPGALPELLRVVPSE